MYVSFFLHPFINLWTLRLFLCLNNTAVDMGEQKWSEVKVAQSCPTLCDPMDYTVHGILQARILECVAFPFFGGSSQPRDRTQISYAVGGFFTSWATREAPTTVKVKVAQLCLTLQPRGLYSPWNSPGQNTGVCSHSLLQRIFPTPGSNPGLRHCRQILYQLTHQGSPYHC